MIDARALKESLRRINEQFNLPGVDSHLARLYSKLAFLEYCGWLEDSMDAVVEQSTLPYLSSEVFKKTFQNKVTKYTSFKYSDFLEMLIFSVGMIGAEKIVRAMGSDIDVFQGLISHVGNRNTLAHTHTSEQTPQVQSPSTIIGWVEKIEPILQNLYEQASAYNDSNSPGSAAAQ